METNIFGGAFQIARKIFESNLWLNKPSTWKVIWIYILGNVNHQKNSIFERGEGFFNFSKNLRNIGNDITEDMVKHFCQYGRRLGMLSTRRSTRGVIIKVINYNTYQTMGNYIRTSLGTSQAREKHERSTTINKNDKNDKNDKNKTIAETAEWDFKKYLEEIENQPRRDLSIIALYWKFKKFNFTNKKQAEVELRRSLRAAKDLEPFEDDKIWRTMEWLSKNANFKWVLESVGKYITENLSALKIKK